MRRPAVDANRKQRSRNGTALRPFCDSEPDTRIVVSSSLLGIHDLASRTPKSGGSTTSPFKSVLQMFADMSHAFPASSRGDCSRMRSNAAECGELRATDQGLESQLAD